MRFISKLLAVRQVLTLFLLALGVAAIIGSGGGGGGDGDDGQGEPRNSYPANVAPSGPSPFGCPAPGVATQAVMQKLNDFWESNVQACSCDAFLLAQGCAQNGFVTPDAYGYIFYDAQFLNQLDQISGSALPADFFMAHEFAHNIQLRLGLNPPGKLKELQADCLGGYYVGYQARSGQVSFPELQRTFEFSCSIGDPFVSNWWDPTHGTCPERVAAVQAGFQGHMSGGLPGQACP